MANKITYSEKLKDPRWQRMRLEILDRDNWTCQKCGATDKTLHVHHRYYLGGKDPWEAPVKSLVTLCFECHDEEESCKDYDKGFVNGLKEAGFFNTDFNEPFPSLLTNVISIMGVTQFDLLITRLGCSSEFMMAVYKLLEEDKKARENK